ncbi:MAG: hypothetical protein COS14_11520 [Bacteroidetes bacterium CG02_land_8_20_14_3_00_31_25]|nr:trypsin-like peptidase domain-containing protein [Bacteroidota bacterium]PIV58074.1 MAG: hypothetical protein COS14_11520 [Bacteroidetes bacterium CG02_land_8_20_14_3_00_31_25]PIX32331.1 MAG: hypothetical protein COZ59_14585 [Bacteroidetes bacterium CG_4_8_14_3_um_filter_31_14]
MDLIRLTELSEKYSNGSLNDNENTELFSALKSDSELKSHFEENIELFKNLDLLQIAQLSKKLFYEVENEQHKFRSNLLFLKQNVIRYTAVAAVTIFAVVGTLYFSGWYSYRSHIQSYTRLGNNISTLTNNQKSLWSALFSNYKSEHSYTTGTGFAISTNGYIITSYHIIKDFDSIFVVNNFDSLIRYRADLVYNNQNSDLAILKINDSLFNSLEKIPFKLSNENINLGEYVYTLGYSKQNIVFGEGSVSSYTGFNEDSLTIQVSIPSNPGNSGGPILNSKGEIVGMLCAKSNEIDGATYAIKSEYLYNVIDSLNSKLEINNKVVLPKYNNLSHSDRPQQIKKIQNVIFKVEAY